jgi:O-antigen/teichoic acid export membrane protein
LIPSSSRPLVLSLLALAHQFLFYGVNVVLARSLAPREFDSYCVAISTVLLLSTIATLGLEKYALRCLPAYREHADVARVRGFWHFASRAVVVASFLCIAVYGAGAAMALWVVKDAPFAFLYLILFLPGIALGQLYLELATAGGDTLAAVAVYRLLLPLALLSSLLLLSRTGAALSLRPALVAYGASWMIALALLWILARRRWRVTDPAVPPISDGLTWIRNAVPFLLGSLLMTALAQSGVIVLGFVATSESVVGRYAVSAQIGTLIALLATSTNRLYLPEISTLIERGARQELLKIRRARAKLIGAVAAVYGLVVVLFGRPILGTFGLGFEEGYPALLWISGGAITSTLFAVGPSFLLYVGRGAVVLRWSAVGLLVNIALCATLGGRLGALGAAIAYAISMGGLVVRLRFAAVSELDRVFGGE